MSVQDLDGYEGGVGSDPHDVSVGRDDPAHEGAVACVVLAFGVGHGAGRATGRDDAIDAAAEVDVAGQIGMAEVEPGIDDGDVDAGAGVRPHEGLGVDPVDALGNRL